MKTQILSFGLLILIIIFAEKDIFGQSQTKSPNIGSQQVLGCLACPGSTWENTQNITADDAKPASTMLMTPPNCFQSTCFFSRGLLASDFRFTVPLNATITGITVSIRRKTGAASTAVMAGGPVKDSIIQLIYNLLPVGDNLKANVLWSSRYTYRVYGGSSIPWNYKWTSAIVNSSGFGVLLKCQQMASKQSTPAISTALVDHIKVKVWYSVNGLRASQERMVSFVTPEPTLYPNPATEATTLQISLTKAAMVNAEIFDITGRKVFSSVSYVPEGKHDLPIRLRDIPGGNYMLKISTGERSWTKKLVKLK